MEYRLFKSGRSRVHLQWHQNLASGAFANYFYPRSPLYRLCQRPSPVSTGLQHRFLLVFPPELVLNQLAVPTLEPVDRTFFQSRPPMASKMASNEVGRIPAGGNVVVSECVLIGGGKAAVS